MWPFVLADAAVVSGGLAPAVPACLARLRGGGVQLAGCAVVPEGAHLCGRQALTKQEKIVVGASLEVFDWSSHVETAEVLNHITDDSARSAIICAIETLRRHTRCRRADVHMLRGGDQRAAVRVVAARLLSKAQ